MTKVIVMILFATTMLAESFHFTEVRYSDAFNSSVELLGEIRFETDALFIKYDKDSRTIVYKESDVTINEGGHSIALDDIQKHRVSQYFDVLLLIHSGNKERLQKKFNLVKNDNTILLKPKDDLIDYIRKIILTHDHNKLKNIELFLSNNDKITIRLDDEIH